MCRSPIRLKRNPVHRLMLCLALTAAATAAAAQAEPAPEFAPSSAFQAAAQDQATGLYILGTTRIRTWAATHYALVHEGRGVQIHTRANGAWLPKLEGSSGGLLVGVAKFDQLLSIAGGANRNAKELPAEARRRFYCLAGFGECGATSAAAHRTRAGEGSLTPRHEFPQRLPSLVVLGTARADEPPCAGCAPYFTLGESASVLVFQFDTATRRILVEGWGIRASWLVPPLDEI